MSHRILVVDDITDNSLLLKTLLESEGYLVDVANDGLSALERMKAAPPDLVLLDIMMPNINGYEVTRSIRQDRHLSAIPIVLITAHMEACRIKGLAVGATDFVRKPVDFDELLSTIQNVLRPRSGKRERESLFMASESSY